MTAYCLPLCVVVVVGCLLKAFLFYNLKGFIFVIIPAVVVVVVSVSAFLLEKKNTHTHMKVFSFVLCCNIRLLPIAIFRDHSLAFSVAIANIVVVLVSYCRWYFFFVVTCLLNVSFFSFHFISFNFYIFFLLLFCFIFFLLHLTSFMHTFRRCCVDGWWEKIVALKSDYSCVRFVYATIQYMYIRLVTIIGSLSKIRRRLSSLFIWFVFLFFHFFFAKILTEKKGKHY